MSFGLHAIAPDLICITLPRPDQPVPFGTPTNVYALLGDAPGLIGTGAPESQAALAAALSDLGLTPASIRRVVATDWSPAQVGGIDAFPNADLFVGSPDLIAPADYAAFVADERAAWTALVESLLDDPRADGLDRAELDQTLEGPLGARLPTRLDAIGLRAGQTVQVGTRALKVVETPGPYPGHLALHAPGEALFTGRLIVQSPFGDPHIRRMSEFLLSVEQLFPLDAAWMLPALGRPRDDVAWHIRRTNRFLTGLLSNLPSTLDQDRSIPEIIERDLGSLPRRVMRLAQSVRRYQAYFDELIRTGVVTRRGDGVWAVYSTGGHAPRLMPG